MTSKYFTFVDADDWLELNAYEKITALYKIFKFFSNTIHIMCCQFDYIPLDIIRTMQETVKEIYPDYMDYYSENPGKVFSLLTIPYNLPIELWEKYKSAYLKFIIYNEQEEMAQICMQLMDGLKRE